MDLDVVLTMGGLAFLGIGLCWFLESTEARRTARHVEDNHAGIDWKTLQERRTTTDATKRKRRA